MKTITIAKLALGIFIVGTLCTGFIPPVQSGSVCATVTFGTTPEDGGPCLGKGVCRKSLCSSTTASTVTDGIMVFFEVSPDDPNVLIMGFHLSDLKISQPDQAVYFTDASAAYIFDAPFPLTDPIFAPLNLLPNAQILPTSSSKVVINGNVVMDYITYSHDNN